MKFRHLFFLAALAPSAQAATDFVNGLVPIELVRQFTSAAVYRSLPDTFPVVTLPEGTDVRLVGSMQRGSTLDALLVTENVGALYDALMSAYTAAGWLNVGESALFGFGQLCHDQLGVMIITRPTPTYMGLRLTHSRAYLQPGQTCASAAAGSSTPWIEYIFGLVPALTPPPQAQPAESFRPYQVVLQPDPFLPGGVVGGTLAYASDIDAPDLDLADLYAYFAADLEQQGWEIDSEGAGEKSATAVAYKVVPPPANVDASDTQLTGFLTLLDTGDATYRVTFSLKFTTDADITLGLLLQVPYTIMGNGQLPPLNEPTLGIRGIPSGFGLR